MSFILTLNLFKLTQCVNFSSSMFLSTTLKMLFFNSKNIPVIETLSDCIFTKFCKIVITDFNKNGNFLFWS